MKIISSWSGGKDSCYATIKALAEGHTLVGLLNMMNENGEVSRSHGLPLSILNQQAEALGVPIITTPATWSGYEEKYISSLIDIKLKHDPEGVVFGDIDLEAHRLWEEKVCTASGLKPLLPLWQQDRKELVFEMIDYGIKAIIVSCNTHLGEAFLGREINRDLVQELEDHGVDVCGENGEYHTVVTDCPQFVSRIQLPIFTKAVYKDYCFITWS